MVEVHCTGAHYGGSGSGRGPRDEVKGVEVGLSKVLWRVRFWSRYSWEVLLR
jgi:hypothetical protein